MQLILVHRYCISKVSYKSFLGLDESKGREIKSRLKDAKHYLKTDYKIHISTAEPCADHCSTYALSTQEEEFKGTCTHLHDITCDRCEEGKMAILDVQMVFSSPQVTYR